MTSLKLFLFLSLSLFVSTSWAQRSERYKSVSERGGYSQQNFNRHDRYQSKPKYERDRFDQNLNRYNNYSPNEKRRAQDKWNNFKQETTPEERRYIIEKMRRDRR